MAKRVYMKGKGPYRVVNVVVGRRGNKTGVVCRQGELRRGKNGNVCNCGCEPCATVGVKGNKTS